MSFDKNSQDREIKQKQNFCGEKERERKPNEVTELSSF